MQLFHQLPQVCKRLGLEDELISARGPRLRETDGLTGIDDDSQLSKAAGSKYSAQGQAVQPRHLYVGHEKRRSVPGIDIPGSNAIFRFANFIIRFKQSSKHSADVGVIVDNEH